ncbi:hypothetical protein Salat_2037700 [Sesamum alatum]|uniref:Cell wall protein n=1 Tax=Sesamum alatum TaxID=300844 RepID=A0AAE2CG58_9LAMI|nr:hypothetical protein Salat_2037700 [Sesamum alatum]
MASNPQTFLGFLVLVSLAMHTVAGRNIPTDARAHPEWLGHFDGTVLVPGIGRFMVPEKGPHAKSFGYNPITGTGRGNGVPVPGVGDSAGGTSGQSYVPGGDDTFLPNPGVEVPNPVGGGVPVPSGH